MTRLEVIDRELTRVRETIDTIASEEVKDLINELEVLLYEQRCILEVKYESTKWWYNDCDSDGNLSFIWV